MAYYYNTTNYCGEEDFTPYADNSSIGSETDNEVGVVVNKDNVKYEKLVVGRGRNRRIVKAFYSGEIGTAIVNPITGFKYPAHRVGSKDEYLFLKVMDTTGSGPNTRTYFFRTKFDYESIFETRALSEAIITKWQRNREKLDYDIIEPAEVGGFDDSGLYAAPEEDTHIVIKR